MSGDKVESRLARLERERAPKGGGCPACGRRADDVRHLEVDLGLAADGIAPRRLGPGPEPCGACGLPTRIATVEV